MSQGCQVMPRNLVSTMLVTISLWKDFQALQIAACVLDWCRFGLVDVNRTLCL